MKKLFVFAICAVGFTFAAQAQAASAASADTKTQDQIAAEKNGTAIVTSQQAPTVEKKQYASTAKSCGGSATKSCCKAKTGEASTAASTEKKSCCKDKAAGAASCKGHENSANGEKKSCAKPCSKKSEH
ncbi:MAG: hypothetical protein FJY15_01725 [Bacteroidetes bacterium]|nr:hypothetical protein [Bacteroidota bacterium]